MAIRLANIDNASDYLRLVSLVKASTEYPDIVKEQVTAGRIVVYETSPTSPFYICVWILVEMDHAFLDYMCKRDVVTDEQLVAFLMYIKTYLLNMGVCWFHGYFALPSVSPITFIRGFNDNYTLVQHTEGTA